MEGWGGEVEGLRGAGVGWGGGGTERWRDGGYSGGVEGGGVEGLRDGGMEGTFIYSGGVEGRKEVC